MGIKWKCGYVCAWCLKRRVGYSHDTTTAAAFYNAHIYFKCSSGGNLSYCTSFPFTAISFLFLVQLYAFPGTLLGMIHASSFAQIFKTQLLDDGIWYAMMIGRYDTTSNR